MVKAGDKLRVMNELPRFNLTAHLNTNETKAFITELESEFGKVKIKTKNGIYAHPLLFIDVALAIDPKLKVTVYKWLYDELVRYRKESGDSYKKMAGALWARTSNKYKFAESMKRLALKIKMEIGVSDWESASEEQLRKREILQGNIALLCSVLKDNRKAVESAFDEFRKNV
jgi:hypothetical protein